MDEILELVLKLKHMWRDEIQPWLEVNDSDFENVLTELELKVNGTS